MIELLPDDVVDQIAAGEVVERPASVVKELVENSLDAGATQVSVAVEQGGKALIRVLDDGAGMTPAEAELALRRHATSKLRRLDDLFGIRTFGFRGEALPSIASVSRLRLTTRPRGALSAVRLEIEAGQIVRRGEVGAPVGTLLEVRDLLFNVPARRKFLKGDGTELAHIGDAVSKLALANPQVHFRLEHKARTTLNAPGHRDGFERARAILGARLGPALVRAEREVAGIRVAAYLAPPQQAQSTARGLQLFVGRRAVRDRGLLHAVSQGYGELLGKGRYPVAVLFVDVPDPDVDVNVHPQKLEVRFSDPQAVFAAVRHTVREAVAAASWTGAGEVVAPPTPAGGARSRASAMAEDLERVRSRSLFNWRTPTLAEARFPMAPPRVEEPAPAGARPAPPQLRFEPASDVAAEPAGAPAGEPAGEPAGDVAAPAGEPAAEPAGEIEDGFFAALRYHGQLDRSYLLCEADGELVLIDQHAAHHRVVLERLRARHRAGSVPAQPLLFAEPLALSPAQAAAADEHRAELERAGFEIRRDGEARALAAAPAGLRTEDPARVLAEVLGELAAPGDRDRSEAMLATIARHAAIRAGDTLSGHEAETLLRDLDAAGGRGRAPGGRSLLLRIGVADIARRLGGRATSA